MGNCFYRFDVLIVGGGPAGASAAKKAAASGLSVLVVDRKIIPGEPMQCAEFVPLLAVQYLRDKQIVVQAITGMCTALPSGAVYEAPLEGVMLDRKKLDEEILQSADLVKFEKSSPIVEEIKGNRNLSERILKSLKPVKEPIKEEENEVE